MTTSAISHSDIVTPLRVASAIRAIGVVVALVGLSLPLLLAEPGPLSSDESLYVAEGLNIALGKGFIYTTGELVNHRGPMFPLLLALDFKLAGGTLDHAYWVPRLFALANAGLVLALGWRFFGRETGVLSAGATLVSSFLLLMGSSLFLDGTETFFMLVALFALHPALRQGSLRWAALSGASLGLATLTKESALLWLPLPLVAVALLGPAVDRPRPLLVAYAASFVAVAGWWWVYVYAVTDRVYLLGSIDQASVWLGVGLACLALGAIGAMLLANRRRGLGARSRWIVAGAIVTAWCALFLIGLERHATWPFPADYATTVPDYVSNVMSSWLRPLPLIGVGWLYVAYRAARGSLSDRLLVLGLLLFLPFLLFAANRDLHLRDALPIVYLSYIALARSAVDFARWLGEAGREALTPSLSVAIGVLLVAVGFGWFALTETDRFGELRGSFSQSVVAQEHWDNPLAGEAAAWIAEEVPAGTPIMSGRLYYSHLYTLMDAEYPIYQLPTVRVDFTGDPVAPERATTLFRWEDHELPTGDAVPWLYLRQYPDKLYYIGLSEVDLLASIEEHEVGYLVLTGDDAGFSSLSLLPYFEDHPAFVPVESFVHDDANQIHIFKIDPDRLISTTPPARVSRTTVASLQGTFGPEGAHELLIGLSPSGYLVTDAPGAGGND